MAMIREWLMRWRDNDALLAPVLAHSALLAEDAEISKDLSAVAAAGLQALDYLQAAQHAPAGWMEQQMALLDRAKRPKGELLLSVEPAVRRLIEAAR
jgi:hexosaminidase